MQHRCNLWFSSEFRDSTEVGPATGRSQMIQTLNNIFLSISQNSYSAQFNSEYKLLRRVYIQSKNQIRSFLYLSSLRKFMQLIKKFESLNIPKVFNDAALLSHSCKALITIGAFRSLEYRLLSGIELLAQVADQALNLSEVTSIEMTSGLFLPYPITYVSMCGSFYQMIPEMKCYLEKQFNTLMTIEHQGILVFPSGAFDFPQLPWNDGMEVDVPIKEPVKPATKDTTLKIEIKARPQLGMRNKNPVQKKGKSVLSSLGF